ncbi:sensor histidine kinase [Actinoplanes aureus]|uniref:histidine kinase n=1 Tax=Actinoplanes aureus TaxID=2792083 RepID=A0A931FXT9_9ACTN|nr:sensor histidine kinase [Actinoplanes aureus]MBG0563908.1 sensor histidine kinase [Actinoplanes aureus]
MHGAIKDRIARLPAAHPLLADGAVAVAMATVGCLLGSENTPAPWREFDPLAYALTVAISLPLTVRRRWPTFAAAASAVLWLAYVSAGYWPVVNAYAMLLAFYTVAARRPARESLAWVAVSAAGWIYAGLISEGSSMAGVVVQGVAIPLIVWWFGRAAGQLEDRNRRLAEAAAALRDGQAERRRRAIADERVRIARELHDVIAHHLTVVSVQAGLARFVLRSDPATASTALDSVIDTSSEALAEMRRMLGLLRAGRDDERPFTPAPGIAGLGDLIDRVRAAGPAVSLTVTGTPRELSPGPAVAVYRIVQESLTNVLKHAAAANAEVNLHFGADELTVTITDDGHGPGPGAQGQGIIGMDERARLYGGSLTAGPREPRGYTVTAVLPLDTAARPEGDR